MYILPYYDIIYIYAVIYIYLISYSISVYLQIWSLDEMVIRVYHHYSTFIVPCFLLPSKTTFWASTLVGLVLNKTRSLSLCLLVESQVVSLDWFKGKNIGTPLYWWSKNQGSPQKTNPIEHHIWWWNPHFWCLNPQVPTVKPSINCHGRASDLSFVICRVESLKGPAPDVRTGVRSQKMLVSYGSENGYTWWKMMINQWMDWSCP